MAKKKLKAFSIIELMTTVVMVTVLLTFGFRIFQLAVRTTALSQMYVEAEVIARDLLELTTAKRNEDWNSLVPGTYYFEQQTIDEEDVMVFVVGTQTNGAYTSGVTISEVYRDDDGNVVSSGGTLDEDVYKINPVVTWEFFDIPHEVSLVQYLSNWRRF